MQVAPSSSTRRPAAATPPTSTAAQKAKKYVNPVNVEDSRKKLKESYEKKFAEAAGVKLVPVK